MIIMYTLIEKYSLESPASPTLVLMLKELIIPVGSVRDLDGNEHEQRLVLKSGEETSDFR